MELELLDVADGEEIEIRRDGTLYLTCCDCGLTHKVRLKMSSNRRAVLAFVRDRGFTTAVRRRVMPGWWKRFAR